MSFNLTREEHDVLVIAARRSKQQLRKMVTALARRSFLQLKMAAAAIELANPRLPKPKEPTRGQPTSRHTEDGREKRRLIVEVYREGKTFVECGKLFGVAASTAHRILYMDAPEIIREQQSRSSLKSTKSDELNQV